MNKIIPLQEMIEEIKKYYNLNDTLLALNLKVTPQTVKGWKDGNIPREKTYNKILEIYNNIINSEEQTKEVTEVTEKKPYEISYPKEYKLMWYLDDIASVTSYQYYNTAVDRVFYESGLLFDTKEEAEQFKREQTLIKKIKCWAKEQQGDWKPDWSNTNQRKYCVDVDRFNKKTILDWCWGHDKLSKLPYFKSKEIAEACIDEFGDEILEVFC
ncbi:hypothetical protein [Gemella morbillorum]